MANSAHDLLAVQEDAMLLDIVASRGDVSSFADDPIAAVLGSWAADIDEGLQTQPVSHLLTLPKPSTVADLRGPRRSTRFLIATGTAVALLGTSGVAAAVTGDPLSPFRAAVKVVAGSGDEVVGASDNQQNHELPGPAATEAEVNQSLRGVNRAIAAGDLEEAQRLLDIARGDASGAEDLAPGLENRIDKLQDKIDGVTHGQPGQGQSGDHTNQSDKKPGQNRDHTAQSDKKPGQITDHANQSDKEPGQNGDPSGPAGGNQTDDKPSKSSNDDELVQPEPDTTPPGKGGTSKGRPDRSVEAGSTMAGDGETGKSTPGSGRGHTSK